MYFQVINENNKKKRLNSFEKKVTFLCNAKNSEKIIELNKKLYTLYFLIRNYTYLFTSHFILWKLFDEYLNEVINFLVLYCVRNALLTAFQETGRIMYWNWKILQKSQRTTCN